MRRHSRPGYGLFQLLVVIAVLAMLAGILLPAVQKVRESAARTRSGNNLMQIGVALHNYGSTYDNRFPTNGNDKNFSALFHLLPYLEQDRLFRSIDADKGCDHKDNARAARAVVKTFLSPLDPLNESSPRGTNYFAMAGTRAGLSGNDGLFPGGGPRYNLGNIPDGTSNTVIFVEMLRGDGSKEAATVQRQHVRLKEAALQNLGEDAGVKEFKADKHIAADRGWSWIDGRFLRATTNATRKVADPKPDVDCGGAGGLAGVRLASPAGTTVGMADGAVHWVTPRVSFTTWQNACNAADGNPLGADW